MTVAAAAGGLADQGHCLGPLGLGLLHSASGGWSLPIAVLLALLVAQTVAAFGESRDRHVLASRGGA
ncbi:hypothetical protein ACEZCY_36765 [Streptacidiphilus sp. N1-12]|uniref:MFS transporter n=2 Tax=Streptacidiphilus alkalitolerans TaxID=3342712 RepID=A0ABV6WRU7_9ACTN